MKNASAVGLVLVNVIVTVCCPPAMVRETVEVTALSAASELSPVRFAYVFVCVEYQFDFFPSTSGSVEYQYTLLLTNAPPPSRSCRRIRYVVVSPEIAGSVSTEVDAL